MPAGQLPFGGLKNSKNYFYHNVDAQAVFEESKRTLKSISISMLILLRAAGAGSCWPVRSLRTYLGMDFSSAMGYALLVLFFYLKT